MIKLSTIDVYKSAYNFWNTKLKQHQEVTWDEFMLHFKEYMFAEGKYEFNEDQLKNLRNILDPYLNMTLTLKEFVIFYQKHWNIIHDRRKILKESVPFPNLFDKQYFLYDLRIVTEKAPKKSLVNEGHVFKFPKLDLGLLIQEIDFDITFGKSGCTNHIIKDQDLFYGKELFRVTPFINGFKMKCNEKNRRLKFKVESKPYILFPGMVIQVGLNTFFKVSIANPVPYCKSSDYNVLLSFLKDKFFESLNDQKLETFEEYHLKHASFLRKYARQSDLEKKYLRLECIGGPEKGKIFDLEERITFKELRYTFGRGGTIDNDFSLSDITISGAHFAITFKRDYGWTIHEESPSGLGTYILFPNYEQLLNHAPSYPHEISDEMKFCLDDFIFDCRLKKIDDKLENIVAKMENVKNGESPKSPGSTIGTQTMKLYY